MESLTKRSSPTWEATSHTTRFMSRSYHITRKSAAVRAAAGDVAAVMTLSEKQIVKQQARKHGHKTKNSLLVGAIKRVRKPNDEAVA